MDGHPGSNDSAKKAESHAPLPNFGADFTRPREALAPGAVDRDAPKTLNETTNPLLAAALTKSAIDEYISRKDPSKQYTEQMFGGKYSLSTEMKDAGGKELLWTQTNFNEFAGSDQGLQVKIQMNGQNGDSLQVTEWCMRNWNRTYDCVGKTENGFQSVNSSFTQAALTPEGFSVTGVTHGLNGSVSSKFSTMISRDDFTMTNRILNPDDSLKYSSQGLIRDTTRGEYLKNLGAPFVLSSTGHDATVRTSELDKK